jgi:hypothetical protein
VGGLVEVHEVHVDGRPRQRHAGLGVQVEQRLLQRVEAGDPHLGRRERVHPRDHAHALRGAVDVQHLAVDRPGVEQHRLPHDAHGQVAHGGQAVHDAL